MPGEARDRERDSGRVAPGDDSEVVFDVQLVDGADGRRLRAEQARVLWEVIAWLAQNSSNGGPPAQRRAA
jgi:hypothetical protein